MCKQLYSEWYQQLPQEYLHTQHRVLELLGRGTPPLVAIAMQHLGLVYSSWEILKDLEIMIMSSPLLLKATHTHTWIGKVYHYAWP